MKRLHKDQNGFIGTVIFLLLLGFGVFFLYNLWEAQQVQFETGVAAEIASASSIADRSYAIDEGFVIFDSKDLPFSFAIPEDWLVNNPNDQNLLSLNTSIEFISSEIENLSMELSWRDAVYDSAEEYVQALREARAKGSIRSDVRYEEISNSTNGAQMIMRHSNSEIQTFYWVADGRSYRLEMAQKSYENKFDAGYVFNEFVSSVELK